ncbi:MAG: alkaline phosphatase family protein [Clostridia bacterium]|nr:alkaline phosphatase family protein [Clostridia bacterium]
MIKNKKENLDKIESYVKNKNYDDIDILDLMRFLAIKKGAKLSSNISIEKLNHMITLKDNVLFILLDGFGYLKANRLPNDSILKNHILTNIDTVNPTSTACVLTSLFTGKYPSEHGIFGWWQYSKKMDLNYYPLIGLGRKTGRDVSSEVSKILQCDSIFDEFKCKVNIFMNRSMIDSNYTKIFSGKKAEKYGTYSIREAFTRIIKRVSEHENTFNYLYIDGLDKTSHQYGVDSKEVMEVIEEVENGIKKLLEENQNMTVILTADHGQVEMTNMIYLNRLNDYLKYFYALPSIDTRTISFFVKEEYKEKFETQFSEEFSEDVVLLKVEEVEKYNIFGNTKFSDKAKEALGEYIAFVVNDKFMLCDKVSLEDNIYTKGNHSGLTEAETKIPLIVL